MSEQASIRVRWDGGSRVFSRAIRIGRDPSCDIVLDHPGVSRVHAEVQPVAEGWMLVDRQSTQGTFHQGNRVERLAITGDTEVMLGAPPGGTTVALSPVVASTAGTVAGPPGTVPAPSDAPSRPTQPLEGAGPQARVPTVENPPVQVPPAGSPPPPLPPPPGAPPVGPSPARPGGALRSGELEGGTVVTGSRLVVECGGRSYEFQPSPEVVIGRDAGCDIVSSNPNVSRRHAALRYYPTGWVFEDLGSSGGSFVDGRKVPRLGLQGSNAIWLGDPETGERLVVVAAGTRQVPLGTKVRKKTPLVLAGLGILVVAALVLSVLALVGGDDSPSNDRLARASVNLTAGNVGGSGTIIDAEQGLLLTNAHVVAPQAEGFAVNADVVEDDLDENPDDIIISIAPGLDKSAEPTFRGEVVAEDGYLDLAVVKITQLLSGARIGDGDLDDLVDVELGDSDGVDTGDRVRALGYPGVEESDAVSLRAGVVSGTVRDDRLGEDSNRGYISIDADIDPGNSGGGAFDDGGRLIGVPSLLNIESETLSKSRRIRPINLGKPMIEAAQAGDPYKSPYYTPLSGDEKISGVASNQPTERLGFTNGCRGTDYDVRPGDPAVSVRFDYVGFPDGAHQDVRIHVVALTDDGPLVIGEVRSHDQYPFEWSGDGCATVVIPLGRDNNGEQLELLPGPFRLDFFVGPSYTDLLQVPFRVPGVIGQ